MSNNECFTCDDFNPKVITVLTGKFDLTNVNNMAFYIYFYSRQPKFRLIRIRLNRSQIIYIYTQRSSGLR